MIFNKYEVRTHYNSVPIECTHAPVTDEVFAVDAIVAR